MHVFFSGIGGTAIGPLAQIAHQAGFTVSGSDKQSSSYINYLEKQGIRNVHIGQTYEQIKHSHAERPIDWYVYSSAVAIEQPDGPELKFCKDNRIRTSKRDEFIAHLLEQKNLNMVAVAGTHGKTTTTAMAVWLMQQLDIPVSYSVGAKIPFGDMGHFDSRSHYFVYEADEFDHNFLAFHPALSIITSIDYDHHEIFPTKADYEHAFAKFVSQSNQLCIWENDLTKVVEHVPAEAVQTLASADVETAGLTLPGFVNRKNAWQVIQALRFIADKPVAELIKIMNEFPGVSRRFERLAPGLYSDYAHTIPKIQGCLQTASELSNDVVVIYEPLTNRRQHYIKDDYKGVFDAVKKVYWVPSYLAREDPAMHTYSPQELIAAAELKNAEPSELNDALWHAIQEHQSQGDTIVIISGGGGNSLDEWVRKKLKTQA